MHVMTGDTTGKSTPAPTDLASCTCANLRKAARAVTQAYDAALQPAGLKVTQFTVLATLAKRGEMPLMKLAEAMVLDRTTLTRNLRPLVARGLVSEAQDADRRVRRLTLTAAGRAALEAALPPWREAQTRLVAALGPGRWAELLGDLAQTVEAARGDVQETIRGD